MTRAKTAMMVNQIRGAVIHLKHQQQSFTLFLKLISKRSFTANFKGVQLPNTHVHCITKYEFHVRKTIKLMLWEYPGLTPR